MSNKKILVITVFLFLVSLLNVHAFDLTTTANEKGACAGSTLLFNALVSGTGSFTANLDREASSWSVVVPTGFTLNNEVKQLYVYVTPKSNTAPGVYNLNLVVTSTSGEVKTINYKINILDCHKLNIQGPAIKDVCGCNVERYDFVVSNQGQFQEYYTVNVGGGASDFVTLSQNTLLLNPGESKLVYAYLSAPCTSFGLHDFTLIVDSQTSNAASSFDSQVNIKNCFDFDLSSDKDFVSLCEHSVEELPIKISNKANSLNNFNLKISGPAWANLENNNLALGPLQTGQVNLVLNPDYRVEGVFDIDLVSEGTEGKIEKQRTIKAEVRKCHDVLFEIIESEDKICNALSKVYDVSIKNTGQFEKEFQLETSEVWAKLDENIITLESGEEKKVNLEITPSVELSAKRYDVYARAIALDTSKVQSEDFIGINVISSENCYKPSVMAQDIKVNQEGSATIPVVIENQGSEPANYNIALSGTATGFSQLNPSTVKIYPGKSEIVYIYTAPSQLVEPGLYKAGVSIRIEDSGVLASTTVNIDVGKAEITEEVILPEGPTLLDKIRTWLTSLFEIGPVIEEVPIVVDFKEEKTLSADARFTYKGEEHTLKILEVSNDSVSLVIESDPKIVLLDVGETKEIDIDSDGVNDLRITLESIEDGEPIIRVVEIMEEEAEEEITEEVEEVVEEELEEEAAPPEEEVIEEEEIVEEEVIPEEEITGEVTEEVEKIKVFKEISLSNTYNNLKDFSRTYRNYIAGAIVVLLIIMLILGAQEFGGRRRRGNKGLGKYLLSLAVLLVLLFLIRTYSNFVRSIFSSYIEPYRNYILVGLAILFVLVILIKYWEKIVDFFEEEIEEEEEFNKKSNKKKPKKRKKK